MFQTIQLKLETESMIKKFVLSKNLSHKVCQYLKLFKKYLWNFLYHMQSEVFPTSMKKTKMSLFELHRH